MENLGITEISLDRGPCFGSCPVFRVAFSRSGSFRYEGSWHVEPLGERVGAFPDFLFDRLAEVCGDLGILRLDDLYPTDFDDARTTTITIRHAGGVKVVRNDDGDAGPAQIWAFAILIEHAMRQAFELDDRKKRKRRG